MNSSKFGVSAPLRQNSKGGFSAYLACVCSISICTVTGFGEVCTDDANCTQNSEMCESGYCVCNEVNNYYNNGSQCDLDECNPNLCQNGGTCNDGINKYTCTCVAGYTGTDCETDIDECNLGPCQNGGTCNDGINKYTCTCVAGYTGTDCETDINECNPGPCKNGGTCSDGINEYTCTCVAGYTGTNCETNIQECDADPCQNSGTCNDGINEYTCTCVAGYTGTNCETNIEECDSNPCKNDGTCNDGINRYTCTCAAGYTGTNCETNIKECNSNPCKNDGTCNDGINRYTCTCVAGYTGTNCETNIEECDSNPCKNDGTCIDDINRYTCTCVAGYTGTNCETNKNDCSPNPCLNRGTCTDKVNDFACTCQDGFTTKTCARAGLGASCDQAGTACEDSNASCGTGSICMCTNNYYDDDGTGNIGGACEKKKDLGATCPSPTTEVPETATCLDSVASCELDGGNYKCKCPDTHFDDNGVTVTGGNCDIKVGLGSTCPQPNACEDTNSQCSSGKKCVCKSSHYDSNGMDSPEGQCTKKVGLGSTCPQPNACENTNSECSSGKKCVCKSSHYDSNGVDSLGGQCTKKVAVGYSCPMSDACESSRAECVGSTGGSVCKCKNEYYDDNTDSARDGTCQNRRRLGDFCSNSAPVNPDQCTDNAQCNHNGSFYVCSCNDRYHREESVCVANKALGEVCVGNIDNECSDPDAKCLDGKCTCDKGYYRYFSTGDSSGVCENVEQLQVTGITFSDIQTMRFTVSWTPPSGDKANHINSYTIEWRHVDNSVSGETRDIPTYSPQTLTGLTPGRTYEVKVISKNTATQPGSVRSTFSTKAQATKPSKPGDITNSDLDARDKSITIEWSPAAGVTSLYRITLLDGESEITSVEKKSTSATLSHSSLKNGYSYVVNIKAKSQAFEGTSYLWSDVREVSIKTKVQVPDPPRNVQCDTLKSESIILTWLPPTLPNGDLVRYNIHVYRYNGSDYLQFVTSTSGVTENHEVIGLSPGTSYRFRVYTENEQYNSTSYDSSNTCTTKAKSADPPENLQATALTSRNFTITWNEPIKIYSEEILGYVAQIKKGSECVREVVYKCADCQETFQVGSLNNLCDSAVRNVSTKTKTSLRGPQTYNVLSLLPDTSYSVTVTVVNNIGRGELAEVTQITSEEAPQIPHTVAVSDIGTTSFKVAWDIADPRPGQTNFTIMLTADSPAMNREFTAVGFNTRSYIAEGLEEFWNYSVAVTAATSVAAKTSEKTEEYRTLPAAPGKVSNFKITEAPRGNYTRMQVKWKAPIVLQRNSIIKEYKFIYSAENTMPTKTFPHEIIEIYEYEVVVDVKPEDTYSFEVYAVNEGNQDGEKITETRQAPAGVPINIEKTLKVEVISKDRVKNRGETSFTFPFVVDFFEEDTYGDIQATGLMICSKDCDYSKIKAIADFDSMDNWRKGSTSGSLYRTTSSNWLVEKKAETTAGSRRKRAVTELEFTVGSDSCSSAGDDEYCNGPLQPDTQYMLVAVTCTNGGCLLSQQYGPFITLAVPQESNLGMIIGIVVGVVVVLAVAAVVAFILIRRRRRGPGGMKPAIDDEDEEFSGIDPALAKIPRTRPVKLNEMEEYVNKMHRDSNLLFSSEYEDLKALSPKHSCEAADLEENRMRNRYINIIPFDHTRVKLSTNGEDDLSDYINANYLPGYNSPREYIGCQGPIPGTIDDFWRMVWEQNVSVVVMLTLCKEGQKIKCEQYWPDEVGEPKQYGDVIVEITSYSNIRTYDYRMFKITNGNQSRVIKHFHFLSWLDFQANVHHDIILDFIQHVRQHVQPPDTSGPMIIHCSAGVGRTGTYITLDHLIQFIYEHDFHETIDIFNMVMKLRENRMHMVQTEQQYVFIHDCVKEIMDRKMRQNENIYANQGFSGDENIYQNENLYANVALGKAEQNTEL